MKSYAVREGGIAPILWTLRTAEHVVQHVPTLDTEQREVRCHELARVVCAVLTGEAEARRIGQRGIAEPTIVPAGVSRSDVEIAARVVDGKFGSVDHSWVVINRTKWGTEYILDPYAVGSMPQVVLHACPAVLSPTRDAVYKPGEARTDIRYTVIERLLWVLSDEPNAKRYMYAAGIRREPLAGEGE